MPHRRTIYTPAPVKVTRDCKVAPSADVQQVADRLLQTASSSDIAYTAKCEEKQYLT